MSDDARHSVAAGTTPILVERALRLLPDLESLEPLRALVLSISHRDEHQAWASSGPYLTLGKRGVDPRDLRQHLGAIQGRIIEHLSALYAAYVSALERQQLGDRAGVVECLLDAGKLEENVGRRAQAEQWYEIAARVAAELPNRRPEGEALARLGRLAMRANRYERAARLYQRGLVLAEAEFDQASTIAACRGLGDAAQGRGEWNGALAWYQRGLRLAEASNDTALATELLRRQGRLSRRRADLAGAREYLARARQGAETLGDAGEWARVLKEQGLVEAAAGSHGVALGLLREALAWTRQAPPAAPLEVSLRLECARAYEALGQQPAAHEELRRAEEVALTNDLVRPLIQVYLLMGRLRGNAGDETGFVFFEQALELCRTGEHAPSLEAHISHEYGMFHRRLGHHDEARAHLETAREAFASLGEAVELEEVQFALQQLSA